MNPPYLLAAREGFEAPGTESFYGRPVVEMHLLGVDVSINKAVLLVLIATAILLGLFTIAFSKPKLVPRGIQNLMEMGVDFVRNQIVLPAMGPKGLVFLPYLTTVFFFIFACNLCEVIPGVSFPPTSRFGLTLVLAIMSSLLFVGVGVKSQGLGYFKNAIVPPGVPAPVLILLIPIELVSTFVVRPATLAIRLMANMIAGHLLLAVFFLGTAYLYGRPLTFGFGVISMFASVGLVGFEIFVAGLQAFIFAMLTAVYIAGSLEPAH